MGRDQESEIAESTPAEAIVMPVSAMTMLPGFSLLSQNPKAATQAEMMMCQYRSPERSELLPTSTIATAATR